MIGIFDSGVGGICAFRELKKRLPLADVIYLADRRNAPYGTKSKDEILKITKNNIKLLKNCGAKVVLIACCTASSMYEMLEEEEREIAIPIIAPAAKAAAGLGERIAVIATRHTATSGAFSTEIAKNSDACVCEFAEQELVSLVEEGNRDGRVTPRCREYLLRMSEKIKEHQAEVLILGCTHFSHLEKEIKKLLPKVKIVSPARVGAEELIRKPDPSRRENGRIVYM